MDEDKMRRHCDDALVERLDNLDEKLDGIHNRLDTLNGSVARIKEWKNQIIGAGKLLAILFGSSGIVWIIINQLQ